MMADAPNDDVQDKNAAEEQFIARVQKLISGGDASQDGILGYLAAKYKETLNEGQVLQSRFDLLKNQTAQVQEALLRTKGRLDGIEKDLRFWDAQSQHNGGEDVPASSIAAQDLPN